MLTRNSQISASLYLIDTYVSANGASALAANALLRYALAAGFPLFILQSKLYEDRILTEICKELHVANFTQVYSKLGIAWATSLLGFISIALLPVPWVLYVKGPSLRKRSNY